MEVHQAAGLRPWYRLHASTWAVVLLVSCGVVFVEIPAEFTVHYIHFDRLTHYEHGWPWVYLERSSGYGLTGSLNSIAPDAIPWLHADCWNLSVSADGLEGTKYRPRYIAPDALVGLLVIGAATSLTEWRRRRRQRVWQFSIGELLIGVLLCASALGWWRYQYDRHKELLDLLPYSEDGALSSMREPASCAFLDFGYTGPGWLVRLVGKGPLEIFNEPVAAYLSIEDDTPRAILELSRNKRWTVHLREIHLLHLVFLPEGKLADLDEESIRNLAQLKRVQRISINGCRLDDRALHQLAEMPNLRELELARCGGMTDVGIAWLRANRHIEELRLRETPFSAEP